VGGGRLAFITGAAMRVEYRRSNGFRLKALAVEAVAVIEREALSNK